MRFLKPLFYGLLLLSDVSGALASVPRPNIVILLADDLGYGDVGFHGSDIRTPHLDTLAATGVRLEQFYVAPICSPTRAGLLTGRYPLRFGLMRSVIPPHRDFGLDPMESTLAELLAGAGYAHRGVFGKWHLGHARLRWHPAAQGFTVFEGCLNGAVDYFTQIRDGERDWHRDSDGSPRKGYTTDLIGDAAVEFIASVPKGEPYFAYVPFTAPHSPFQAKESDAARYPHRTGRSRTYAAMVDSMDQAIGRIVHAIEARGDAGNTFILFCSDNGGVRNVGDNGDQRAGKLTPYQGGIRVAAVARWPEGGLTGGRTTNARMGYIDVVPTLMALVNPDLVPERVWDGINVIAALRTDAPLPDRAWFTYMDQGDEARERLAVSRDRYKLVVTRDAPDATSARPGSTELFEIASDPTEAVDLSARDPDTVRSLEADLARFLAHRSANPVGRYSEGSRGFTAPSEWRIERP